MKIKAVCLSLCAFAVLVFADTLHAQGTEFTYQGQLNNGGSPANGLYDFTFAIFNSSTNVSPASVTLTNSAVAVTNGLFATTLDFGGNVFNGNPAWLEIGVATNGNTNFVTLSPRQLLTPTPYAITAGNVTGVVPGSSVAGTYGSAVTFSNAANQFAGNGSNLTSLNASQLSSGTVADTRLSSNVALLNGTQTFSRANEFTGGITTFNSNGGYALTVNGDQTNTGALYIGNQGNTPFGIMLGMDGGIHTGGYVDISANDRIYALPAMQSFMFDIGCDVPLGIIIYDGAPSLVTCNQLENGLATNQYFLDGTMTFTLGQYGQVILNNPLNEITNADQYQVEFDAPQLIFQNEQLQSSYSNYWSPTNYFGILQTQSGLSFGQMTNPTVITSTGGTTKDVVGNLRRDLIISTNGSVTISSNLVVDGSVNGNGSGLSNVVVSVVSESSSYTAAATDELILVTATGLTITLSTAVGIEGHTIIVKMTASGSVTVATTSGQTIDGASTYSLSAQYKYVRLTSDNANWQVTGNN